MLVPPAFVSRAAWKLRALWNRRSVSLQGQWPSSEHFYATARDYISRHPDGWTVHTHHPGHPFVAWEVALRYEAACQEARYRYIRLCYMSDHAGAAENLERIAELLAEAERLSRVERAIRRVLAADTDDKQNRASGNLVDATSTTMPAAETGDEQHSASGNPVDTASTTMPAADTDDKPTKAEPVPVAPRAEQLSPLRPLASKYLSDIMPQLQQAFTARQQEAPFHPDVTKLLREADRQIPGPGIHTAVWHGRTDYLYPFDEDYQAVLRPLRYVPADLLDGYRDPLRSREIVTKSGVYLEGCIKTALRDTGTRQGKLKKPLGSLSKKRYLEGLLDPTELSDLREFTNIAVNPAKHDFVNERGPESLFNYEDAVYAYYLARRLGAEILQNAGSMSLFCTAVETAIENRIYFWGAMLSLGEEPSG